MRKGSNVEAGGAGAGRERVKPDWSHERELHSRGYRLVAGVDEVGRGAWAGPLVAAAVVFPHPDTFNAQSCPAEISAELGRLRDSKMLSARVREELLDCIRLAALAIGVGVVSPALLDVIGVGPANRLAMTRSVRDLGVWPDFLLLDAFRLPLMPTGQRPIIRGDATCMSIAAASIVAKVTRDRIMEGLSAEHEGYSFNQHKGYGTRLHAEALLRQGVSPSHRRSFAPVRAIMLGEPYGNLVVHDAPIEGGEGLPELLVSQAAANGSGEDMFSVAAPGARRHNAG